MSETTVPLLELEPDDTEQSEACRSLTSDSLTDALAPLQGIEEPSFDKTVSMSIAVQKGRAVQTFLEGSTPLSDDDVRRLKIYGHRGVEARNNLALGYWRIAHKALSRYMKLGLPHAVLADLFQAGLEALIRCAGNYDHTQSSFETYAYWPVRSAMSKEFRLQRSMPPSVWRYREFGRLAKMAQEITGLLHREPTEAELAAGMGLSISQLRLLKRHEIVTGRALSLSQSIGASITLENSIGTMHHSDSNESWNEIVNLLLSCLPETERNTVDLRLKGWKLGGIFFRSLRRGVRAIR